MSNTKIITAACGVVAAAGLIATGATLSNAATPAAQTGTGTYSNAFGSGAPSGDRGHGSNDTPVTGTELAKVSAAVKAKDSAVTVTARAEGPRRLLRRVRHEGGVAGHARGQQGPEDDHHWAWSRVRRPGARRWQGHGMNDTPVTGTELSNVKAAVKAKDSAVTVTKRPQGPRRLLRRVRHEGGGPVMLEVSKDLKTITTGPRGGGHGGGSQPAPSSSSSSTATT